MSFTGPKTDWLIGMEYIPDISLPEFQDGFKGSMRSLGIGIFRIDFLTNKIEE